MGWLRHELDTIYCAVGVCISSPPVAKSRIRFLLNLEGAYLGDLASSGSDMRRNHAVLALFAHGRSERPPNRM